MRNAARVPLGTYPTPIETLGDLRIKRDDLTSATYGGNKVRKLELLLGAARAEGKARLVTIGAAGSHQVVATALYGKREGFAVEAVLVAQPASDHARDNLRAAIALGLVSSVASSWASAPVLLATRLGRDAYVIPLGGSNALGSLGFVDAARELAAQIEAGVLPEPDVVVVAMGSGGTAAGLAVGFEAIGMRTRVVGVAISPPARVLGVMARRVATKTAELLGMSRGARVRAAQRIDVETAYLGRGYGHPTPASEAATRIAARAGLSLDPTYTAKAFACALERSGQRSAVSGQRSVLYWHTLSSAPLAPLLEGAAPLPPEMERLLR